MEIILARAAGYCFGVKRAIQVAEAAARETGSQIYTYGPLIHNRQAVAKLEEQGIKVIENLDSAAGEVVIIRSHGVGPEILNKAEELKIKLVDATCPFVKKAQEIARSLQADGYTVIVVGEAEHPEVKGIIGWTEGKGIVVQQPEDLQLIKPGKKIGVLAQTTQPLARLQAVVKELLTFGREVRVFNTICHATEERQQAARELASQVEVMLVVGGAHSANTQKLAAICRESGATTYAIETAAEIQTDWFKGVDKVGITAGASTPDWIIEEVVKKMTDIRQNEQTEQNPQDMEQLLNEALEFQRVSRGQKLKGTVVSVSDDEVLVDIGAKSEAVVPLRELTCCPVESAREYVKPGDEIEVVVLKVEDMEGRIVCSKQKADAMKAMNTLEEAYKTGQKVTGRVAEVIKGGLLVDLGVRAFLPASHVDVRYVENLEKYVGQEVAVKIIEFNRQKARVVVSRKAVIEEEQLQKKTNALATLAPGQIVKGKVRRITSFGAFVDLGGIDGLLHISELAWHHVDHPAEVIREGEEIEVKILDIDQANEKISLSRRQVLPSPWETVEKKYPVGSIVKGKVVRLVPFGAFVELEPGVDGLIHLSQLADRRVAKADEVVQPGQEVLVKVIDVKSDEKRISLSLKEAQGVVPEA
ncbi:4-hydroxy-3-methylbut-2-enyl diphosphate reductase [Carboxydocella thermautotrophica]|nr:4-hydroxy-3-methylbut-2-enyl diphosphate reductase [Carboxydocella thermautotrophica]